MSEKTFGNYLKAINESKDLEMLSKEELEDIIISGAMENGYNLYDELEENINDELQGLGQFAANKGKDFNMEDAKEIIRELIDEILSNIDD